MIGAEADAEAVETNSSVYLKTVKGVFKLWLRLTR
jgi:hypothetical protein